MSELPKNVTVGGKKFTAEFEQYQDGQVFLSTYEYGDLREEVLLSAYDVQRLSEYLRRVALHHQLGSK